jgi:hypothetical protein
VAAPGSSRVRRWKHDCGSGSHLNHATVVSVHNRNDVALSTTSSLHDSIVERDKRTLPHLHTCRIQEAYDASNQLSALHRLSCKRQWIPSHLWAVSWRFDWSMASRSRSIFSHAVVLL